MDPRSEFREFLATRRAKITPDQAGMPLHGGRRRVPGLRREEAATIPESDRQDAGQQTLGAAGHDRSTRTPSSPG